MLIHLAYLLTCCFNFRFLLRATIMNDNIQYMTRHVSVFAKCDTIFTLFLEITTNWNFQLSQGNAKYYMGFVRNLCLFPVVKEFCKSVKN